MNNADILTNIYDLLVLRFFYMHLLTAKYDVCTKILSGPGLSSSNSSTKKLIKKNKYETGFLLRFVKYNFRVGVTVYAEVLQKAPHTL